MERTQGDLCRVIKNVLYIGCRFASIGVWIYQNALEHLKWWHFIECKLYSIDITYIFNI